MFSICEIIDLAIQIEKNGERIYRRALKAVKNPELISMLEWLMGQETQHAKWLSKLNRTLAKTACDPKLEAIGRDILQDFLGDQTFSLQDADLSKVENVEALLKISIEFKKDIVLFYEMIGSFIEEEKTLDSLKLIIHEEKQQVKVLKEFQRSFTEDPVSEPLESDPVK